MVKKFLCVFGLILLLAGMAFPVIPQAAFAEGGELSVQGKAAYLSDYETGTVIYESNADERLQIASMVKIMTSLLAFEAIERGELKMDEVIEVSAHAAGMGGSQIFLDAGSKHTVANLLKSIAVASANDSSVAIAERVGGSESGFVKMMNARAKELGMNNTNFVNSTGLPGAGQYSTARDVSRMTGELSRHKQYKEFCKVWLEDYVHPDGRVTAITNTNKLVRFYKGCDCGKTGFTSEAMYCLSASAERNGLRIIATLIGAPTSKSRNYDVSKMFDYAFGACENRVVLAKGEEAGAVKLKGGKAEQAKVVAENNLTIFAMRGEEVKYEVIYDLPERVKAPLSSGQTVGTAKLIVDGKTVKEVNLVTDGEYGKATLKDIVGKITSKW